MPSGRTSIGMAYRLANSAAAPKPTAVPSSPDTSDTVVASQRNCVAMEPAVAPTALRSPTSATRSRTTTSMMLAMTTAATSSTTAAAMATYTFSMRFIRAPAASANVDV